MKELNENFFEDDELNIDFSALEEIEDIKTK